MSRRVLSNVLGLVGAALGGAIGFWLFGQLLKVNLYGLVLPGALLGLGCDLLSRHVSTARGIACGVAGLVLGLFAEWWHFPFQDDPSFAYFLAHLGSLDRGVWAYAMLAVGTLLAFWWGRTCLFGDRKGRPIAESR
jgi:hypothetical protein